VAFRLARPDEAPSLWSRTIDRPGGRFMGGLLGGAILVLVLAVLIAGALWRRRKRMKTIS
jgi:quinoprotein glucose dehydrogenase